METSALEIVQTVSEALGFNIPATITAVNDTNTRRVLAFVNMAVEKIRKEHPWQSLQRAAFITAAADSPAYNQNTGGLDFKKLLPDFSAFVSPAIYESGSFNIIKYLSPAQFDRLRANGAGALGDYFSVYGNNLYLLPGVKEKPRKITFRYSSKYAVIDTENNGRSYKPRFTKDADECEFESELVILGGLYKYKQEMGLDYADNMNDYAERLEKLKNEDAATPIIDGAGSKTNLPVFNIPENIPTGAT